MSFVCRFSLAMALSSTLLPLPAATAQEESPEKAPPVLDFKMKTIDGKEADLAKKYKGKVLLMVNVASKCGYTPQYAGLQELFEKYDQEGFVILGFPANEFGRQEPGSNEEIKEFCTENYGVTFDMFEKVVVKGKGICPLYEFLTSKKTNPEFGGPVAWNFEKFLIGRNGQVVGRFKSGVKPGGDELIKALEEQLKQK